MTDRCEPAKLAERFWSKVDKSGGENSCWPWLGATDGRRGYGQFFMDRRHRKATHVAWELANASPFPEGKHACHSCDNPPCVNPRHIWPGTHSENHKDSFAKNRCAIRRIGGGNPVNRRAWTHCQAGHEFTHDNTIVKKSGRRQCRQCTRKWGAAYDAKRRAPHKEGPSI